MTIPKSDKLSKEEDQDAQETTEMKAPAVLTAEEEIQTGPLQIREVQCLNDFVAILQDMTKSSIMVPDASKYKNEGVVVGVGPGIADGAGGRLTPVVSVGEAVMFGAKNIVAEIESDSPPYAGHKVIIVSERNIICKLPKKIEWEPYAEI
jgi:co-chaperonin GroES (HSP10)